LNFRLLDDPETQHTAQQVTYVFHVNCQPTQQLPHYFDYLLSNHKCMDMEQA